jgi:hypothetical protein
MTILPHLTVDISVSALASNVLNMECVSSSESLCARNCYESGSGTFFGWSVPE